MAARTGPWTGYDHDTLTDDLDALVHHLDVRDVVLVGPSPGNVRSVVSRSEPASARL